MSSPTIVHSSLSSVITFAHRQLITIELLAVFFGSLAVSAIRFNQDVRAALLDYPGAPKVFIYPLIWYYFLYRTHSWDRSILFISSEFYSRVLRASWQSLIAFAAVAFLLKYPISRIWVISNAVAISTLLLLIRYLLRRSYFRNYKETSQLKYLYIGSKRQQSQTIEDFQSTFGFNPIILQFDPPNSGDSDRWLELYEKTASSEEIYGVIIGVGEIQDASLLRQLADTNRKQIIDFILATKIGAITHRFERLESPIMVRIRESSIVSGGAVIKRIFDVFFSSLALLALLPLFAVVALAIKLTSNGPILYVDKRVGADGKLFTFPKFRSMYQGADKQRLQVLGRPDDAMADRYKRDPRITPFGRIIRRWSIDELPQFWCVLIGTMSVVGPRPILQEELVQIPDDYQIRFLAKPGLTGLWQVTGRKEVAWHDRMIRDISYIDNWNMSTDLLLIGKTIGAILSGEGAH